MPKKAPTKPKKAKAPAKGKSKAAYTASIKVLGRLYKGNGKTLLEAFQGIQPGNVKGMGLLVVSNGKMTKEKVIAAPMVFKLFGGGRIMKEVALKNMCMLFSDL